VQFVEQLTHNPKFEVLPLALGENIEKRKKNQF
jgi:hypothetical protein